jgi:hypothetical protein
MIGASPAQVVACLHIPKTSAVKLDVVDHDGRPLVLLVELGEVRDVIREGARDREDFPLLLGRCGEGSKHFEVLEQRTKQGVEGREMFEREGVLSGGGR